MASPFSASAHVAARTIAPVLDDRVVPYAAGATTTDALGGAVPGDPVAGGPAAARVRPESSEERRANDRPENVTGYRVRLYNTPGGRAVAASGSLSWTTAPGGTRLLEVASAPVRTVSGEYLDLTATYSAPS